MHQSIVLVTSFDSEKYLGTLVITSFEVTGKRSYHIDFSQEMEEFRGLSRCSAVGGAWTIEEGSLHVVTTDTFQLYSGPYYGRDYSCSTELIPEYGESHMLIFRSRGAASGYLFGYAGCARLVLYKRDKDLTVLTEKEFPWKTGKQYTLTATCRGNRFTCSVNGQEMLTCTDDDAYAYGMAGVGKLSAGRTRFLSLEYKEL